MHQERDYPARVSGTDLVNPGFRRARARLRRARRDGACAPAEFAPAFERALAAGRPGAAAREARSAGADDERVARRAPGGGAACPPHVTPALPRSGRHCIGRRCEGRHSRAGR